MKSEMTNAASFAAWMGNDGQIFEAPTGEPIEACLHDVCRVENRTDKTRLMTDTRYEFADGSAIVVSGDCWDIEGELPFEMAGA